MNSIAHADGNTPLHLALMVGNFKTAKMLLDHGAQVTQNLKGDTPDVPVPQQKQKQAIVLFRKSGVPFSRLGSVKPWMSLNYMAWAISNDDYDMCAEIMTYRSSSSVDRLRCGCTPLASALARGSFAIVKFLIGRGSWLARNACKMHRKEALYHNVIELLLVKAGSHRNLWQVLNCCTQQGVHWCQNSANPFYVASAVNCDALELLIQHVEAHESFYQ